jgi:hypothetical protein
MVAAMKSPPVKPGNPVPGEAVPSFGSLTTLAPRHLLDTFSRYGTTQVSSPACAIEEVGQAICQYLRSPREAHPDLGYFLSQLGEKIESVPLARKHHQGGYQCAVLIVGLFIESPKASVSATGDPVTFEKLISVLEKFTPHYKKLLLKCVPELLLRGSFRQAETLLQELNLSDTEKNRIKLHKFCAENLSIGCVNYLRELDQRLTKYIRNKAKADTLEIQKFLSGLNALYNIEKRCYESILPFPARPNFGLTERLPQILEKIRTCPGLLHASDSSLILARLMGSTQVGFLGI